MYMNILSVINEEAKALFENLEVYTIHDLAEMLKRLPDIDPMLPKIIEEMLMKEYRQGGDQAVIDMYQSYAGVEIEALRNGRYVFHNMTGGSNPHYQAIREMLQGKKKV